LAGSIVSQPRDDELSCPLRTTYGQPEARLKAIGAALLAVGARPRRDVLRALQALSPAIASYGDGCAVADAADAVVVTGRWFP
jgi:hypothetical protein